MKAYLDLGVILAAAVLCQLFFAPTQVLSQEDPELTEIQGLIHQIDSLIDARQLDTAIVLGTFALEKGREKFGKSDTTVANVLHLLGICFYNQANYAKCESLWSEVLSIQERVLGPDHPRVGKSLNDLAVACEEQGKFAEAEPLYKLALSTREKALGSEHPDVATTLHNLAILHMKQGQYAEAGPLYQRAYAIRLKILGPEHRDVAASLNNLGLWHKQVGEYGEAESDLKQALSIWEKLFGPDHPGVALSLDNLANVYRIQGKYGQAKPLYKRALAIREKTLGPEHPLVAGNLSNLALLYWKEGRVVEGEPLMKRALAIRKKVHGSEHYAVASALHDLAIFNEIQGKYAKAESLYHRALAMKEKVLGAEHPDVAASLNNLSILYKNQGQYAEAESLQRRAIAIREKAFGPEHPKVARSLYNLANIYRIQSNFAEAESLCRRALRLFEKDLGSGHPEVAGALTVLGVIRWTQGRYAEAEPFFKRSLAIYEKTLGAEHPDVAGNLRNMAVLCSALGQAERSLAYYKKLRESRQHFIEYLFSYASEDQKMRYVKEYPLVDHSFISFAVMFNLDDSRSSSLEMILKGKAAVIDAVSAEKQIAFCSYDEEIQKKAERHAEVCGEISTLTLAGAENLEPDIYRDRLQTLYSMKDSLETVLSKSCAEFKDELAARRFEVADVANALPQGSVLWEFIRYEPYDFKKLGSDEERTGPPRYHAFTLDHAGNISLTDLGDAGEIDSLVSLAREQIYKARAEVYSPLVVESEKRLNGVTGKLYDIIFAPLESYLGTRTDILISPDGQLNLLPFEILPCSDGKYVIEKFKISYLSSGRDLLRFKKRQEPTDWALVMADPDFDLSEEALAEHRDETLKKSEISSFVYEPSRGVSGCLNARFSPLPYSREETKSVVKTLKKKANLKTRSYHGGDALEEVLKGMTTAPRVLHLATHGYFCEDVDLTENRMLESPMIRSGLALAGANRLMDENRKDVSQPEDGVLTAFEASGLNLIGTELVTLSACETGVGEVKSGEGVYGLRRAFQHAGARSILMSLWKVPDKETCELMDHFYKSWLTGQTKKEALRQSALKILNACRAKYGAAHPLFWGGFVMGGDPN